MKPKVDASLLEELVGSKEFVLLRLDVPELLATDVFDPEGYTLEGGSRLRDVNEEEFEELVSGVVASARGPSDTLSTGLGLPDLGLAVGDLFDGIGLHWLGEFDTEDRWEMLMIVGYIPPTVTSEEPPEWEDLSVFVLGAWKEGLDLSKEERDQAYDNLYDALRIEWRLGGNAIGMAIRDEYCWEEVGELPDEMVPLEGASRFYSHFYPNRIKYRGECPQEEASDAIL